MKVSCILGEKIYNGILVYLYIDYHGKLVAHFHAEPKDIKFFLATKYTHLGIHQFFSVVN